MPIFSKRSRNKKDVQYNSVSGEHLIVKFFYFDTCNISCEITVASDYWIGLDFAVIFCVVFMVFLTSLNYDIVTSFMCVFFSASLTFITSYYRIKTENLLIIPTIGVQFCSISFLGRTSSWFVPWTSVEDIIINEALSYFCVKSYLALLTTDKDNNKQLKPLFQCNQPQLACLEDIYQACQKALRSKHDSKT